MIIQGLKLVLEETDVSAWMQRGLGAVNQVRDVTFSLVPGAAKLGGKFQVGFSVPFDTRWSVEVLPGGKLGLKLSDLSVGFFGMSAATVRQQVMGALAQKLQGVAGVAVDDDVIVVDPAVVLLAKGIRLEAPVRRVDVKQGRLELEV